MVMMAILPFAVMAQQEEDTENGVVSLAGRKGFTIQSKKGDFVFKPYLMVQTAGNFNWYDDEGLDKLTTKTILLTPVLPFRMPCLVLREKHLIKSLSTFPSMRQQAAELCCSRLGLM